MGDGDSTRKPALGPFQIVMMSIMTLVTVAGGVGVTWYWLEDKPAQQAVIEAPEAARSAFAESPEAPPTPSTEDRGQAWLDWLSTRGVQIGGSFLSGFAIGVLARLFIKTALILVFLLVGGAVALSYFGFINLDLTAAQQQWTTHGDWVTEQAIKLRDVLWAHLPTSTAGLVGLAVGLIRR